MEYRKYFIEKKYISQSIKKKKKKKKKNRNNPWEFNVFLKKKSIKKFPDLLHIYYYCKAFFFFFFFFNNKKLKFNM